MVSRYLRHVPRGILLLAGLILAMPASQAQKADVNVNLYGAFPTNATAPGEVSSVNGQPGPTLQQTADASAGFRIGARYIFRPLFGLELNYGYNRATQHFTGNDSQTGTVYAHGKPLTIDYVASVPMSLHGWQPFVLAGGGYISYNISSYQETPPGRPAIPARPEKIPAFEFGFGADYHPQALPNFMSLRLQYRGLLAHAPDFRLPYLQTNNFTIISEPQIGVAFKF